MGYSMRQLRQLSCGGESNIQREMMSMDEAVTWLSETETIDEAFYGKKPIAKIQKAMDDMRMEILMQVGTKNQNIDYVLSPGNKALQKAIKDTFGFKSVTIYWTSIPSIPSFEIYREEDDPITVDLSLPGGMTVPSAHIINRDGRYIKPGQNQNGFYDKDHRLRVVISLPAMEFLPPVNLTSEEMVATLLHELGHNFDYTIWSILDVWFAAIDMLVDIAKSIAKNDLYNVMANGVLIAAKMTPIGREIGLLMNNLTDVLVNIIPPVGEIYRKAGAAVEPVIKLLKTITAPIKFVKNLPVELLSIPISAIGGLLTRKGETYADSFATAYGYGNELITGLNKSKLYRNTTTVDFGPATNVLNDLSMLKHEVFQACWQKHGSLQQRSLRILDSLNEDLKKANLTKEDRKAIEAERDKIMKTYDKFVQMDNDQHMFFTKLFRELMDNWYAGKPYIIFQNIDKNYAN